MGSCFNAERRAGGACETHISGAALQLRNDSIRVTYGQSDRDVGVERSKVRQEGGEQGTRRGLCLRRGVSKPVRSCARRAISSRISASTAAMRSAWRRNASPCGVKRTRGPPRSSSRAPSSRSSRCTWRLTAGWLILRAAAASEKLPRLTISNTVRMCETSIIVVVRPPAYASDLTPGRIFASTVCKPRISSRMIWTSRRPVSRRYSS